MDELLNDAEANRQEGGLDVEMQLGSEYHLLPSSQVALNISKTTTFKIGTSA